MRSTFLKSLAPYLFALLVIAGVLLFIPATPNFFTSSKQLVFLLGIVVFLILWTADLIAHRELSLPTSALGFPLFLFTVVIAANFFVNKEGWLEALTGRGSLYLGGVFLAYFASLLSSSVKAHRYFLYSFFATATALAIHSLLQLTVLYKLDSLPAYLSSRAATPTGSPLISLTILAIGAAVSFYHAAKSLKGAAQYLLFVAATLQTIAAVAYLSLMLPGGSLSFNLLPYQASWSVTLDALKSPLHFLFGVGLANFTNLFTAVKPLSLNSTAFWNFMPVSATSEFFQLLSTAGVMGLGAMIFLIISVLTHQASRSPATFFLFILASVALLLTPASIPVLTLFFISAGLLSSPSNRLTSLSRPVAFSISIVICLLALAISFYSVRAYAAENHLYRAQKALASNDGKTVYEQHLAAIKLMPAMSNYRLSYSQINLSLASALSQKKDLTDAERQQVTALVQQSISEAKIAATLHKSDYRTWQNLGNIYRNLINVASGADQFAVSAYAQAVTLNPADPALRVEFGGLLYQLSGAAKDKDTKNALLSRAVQEFQTAVQLKSDYANGYYNLSRALESAGNTQGAYAAMQKAVASLDPSSPDVSKATAEMETLKGKLPKATPSPSPLPAGSEISQPSPLPSPLKGGPIDLPTDSPVPSPQ